MLDRICRLSLSKFGLSFESYVFLDEAAGTEWTTLRQLRPSCHPRMTDIPATSCTHKSNAAMTTEHEDRVHR
jgi:hypothetical protein